MHGEHVMSEESHPACQGQGILEVPLLLSSVLMNDSYNSRPATLRIPDLT